MRKRVVIVDLDGTLCNNKHRNHLIEQTPPQWDAYFEACDLDTPHDDIIDLLRSLDTGYNIHIFSGRGMISIEKTGAWLRKHRVPYDQLFMRPVGDFTPDQELKLKWAVECGYTPDDVLCVLDDRQKVVDMWRANGYTCLQVAPGDF